MTGACHGALLAALLLWSGAPWAQPVSITDGALTLRARLEIVSAGGLADGVAMLVHGTLAHAGMEIIATLQSLLAERGLNTLAITLSLGQSDREGMFDCAAPHTHRHQDAVREIGLWMDWLAGRGAGPVTLIGHSRGGNQAARFALDHPGRLRALVLIAPATFDAARVAADYRRQHGVDLAAVIARARRLAPDDFLDGVGFLYCGPSRVSAGSFLSYYTDDGLQDTPGLLPRITVPTLVVAGSADTTVPDAAARTRPHEDGDTRLVVIDGADHFFRDLYAEDLADAIAAHIQEH